MMAGELCLSICHLSASLWSLSLYPLNTNRFLAVQPARSVIPNQR
jgi:hypothetical protein